MQALWMVVGAFLFATMGVCVKLAATGFTVAELVFYRGAVSAALIWLFMRAQGTPLRTQVPWMHAWRSLIGNLSLGAWFFAIGALPLATAMTLNYTSGMWIALWIVCVESFRRQVSRSQFSLIASVAASFLGVLLVLRPTVEQNQWFAALVGLASGISAALAYLQVAALGKAGDPDSRTVFYFAMGSAVVGLIGIGFTGLTAWTA